MREIPVIFEDDEIFVINKPSGMSVQGGKSVSHPLDEELSRQVGFKVHLVHRLDKETSGLMVVAKNARSAAKWIEKISSKQVQKEYTAICFGEPFYNGKKQKSGVISESVIRKNGKNVREQSAVTQFRVEEVWTIELPAFSDNSDDVSGRLLPVTFSKIHLKLGTGRMHQIRIHLAGAGAPICGDDKHGNFKLNRLIKKYLKVKNLLLCSTRLTVLTDGGKSRTFGIELPDFFTLETQDKNGRVILPR